MENDWNPGTWVLIWVYSAGAIQWVPTWQGVDGFKKLCVLVLWMKVALALEGLRNMLSPPSHNLKIYCLEFLPRSWYHCLFTANDASFQEDSRMKIVLVQRRLRNILWNVLGDFPGNPRFCGRYVMRHMLKRRRCYCAVSEREEGAVLSEITTGCVTKQWAPHRVKIVS